jgi:hypothetical protein
LIEAEPVILLLRRIEELAPLLASRDACPVAPLRKALSGKREETIT